MRSGAVYCCSGLYGVVGQLVTESSRTVGSQMLGRSKKFMLDTPSSGVDAKVKRGAKHELALLLKQSLLVSFQDCQKASMTA